jgi:LysM repeat protein
VARRETLPGIAKQYGTTVAVITKLNDLKGRKLSVGESLKIPENQRPAAGQGAAGRGAGRPAVATTWGAGSARSCTACAPARP